LLATTARADGFDDVFAGFKPDAPGCALGVAHEHQPPVLRAYGSADLAHRVAIVPETIFEAGSVSKQFTAAAILMLVTDGKIGLSDDIRKYLPEMPSYGAPITIDHLLSHTSGLRDWGDVVAVGGWPRGTRAYSNLEALEIAALQSSLNFQPGTAYSYTNTGYNLLAVIVSRVSGQSLADFTRERLFKPLGMAHTQWRDDFTRVVPGRAEAYRPAGGGQVLDMPFETAYGNGGLLTTVGDLLIWNEALTEGRLGSTVTMQLQQRATLTDGRKIEYARGLSVTVYHGSAEVSHGGATAGYRAWLGRFARQGLSIAVLCNAGNADAESLAHKVADLYLPPAPAAPSTTQPTPIADISSRPGTYVSAGPPGLLRILAEGDHLRLRNGPVLRPIGVDHYVAGPLDITFRSADIADVRSSDGEIEPSYREDGPPPASAEYGALVGTYASREADATVQLSVSNGLLTMVPSDRPSLVTALRPLFKDGYVADGGPTVGPIFVRVLLGKDGKVESIRFQTGRAWNLVFQRIDP
jgi:CubicO group peptidase (beta-lactamase class C family)